MGQQVMAAGFAATWGQAYSWTSSPTMPATDPEMHSGEALAGTAERADAGRESRYEQCRSAVAQLTHVGRVSSHLTWRRLHSLQPLRDFLCARRSLTSPTAVAAGVAASSATAGAAAHSGLLCAHRRELSERSGRIRGRWEAAAAAAEPRSLGWVERMEVKRAVGL